MTNELTSKRREKTIQLSGDSCVSGQSSQNQLVDFIQRFSNLELAGLINVSGYNHSNSIIDFNGETLKKIYVNEQVSLSLGEYGLSTGHGGCQAICIESTLNGQPQLHLAHTFGGTPERA